MAGIYIHVPFCSKKCLYCDFFSKTDMSVKNDYITALLNEISQRKVFLEGDKINTLYFGGGTPSQLSENDFEELFKSLDTNFDLSCCKEITIEVNPDDIDDDYIRILNKFPFNRISMGIQSFKDSDLKFLNRRHTSDEAINVVRKLQNAGYNNISIDLIYGIPGQTIEDWKLNIEKAVSLGVQHISAYHLIYEEGTPLFKLLEKGKIKEVDEDLSLEMFKLLISELEKYGFVQYEISNFCLPEYYSRHNSSYWNGDSYLGLGPGAHSYYNGLRSFNKHDIKIYNSGIDYFEDEILSQNDIFNDYILTRIRVMQGMSICETENRFGKEKTEYILKIAEKYISQNMLEIIDGYLRLTKNGIFISDAIMSDMMIIDD